MPKPPHQSGKTFVHLRRLGGIFVIAIFGNGCHGRPSERPGAAIVGLFEAAKARDCQRAIRFLAPGPQRERIAADRQTCDTMLQLLDSHHLEQLGRPVPDGRAPASRVIVSAILRDFAVPRRFTLVSDRGEWKVSSY